MEKKCLRLGILGGTFDPVHLGHLRIAEEMCEELDLERVLLIPGALPPHKNRKAVTPFSERLAMTRIAAQASPLLEVLDLVPVFTLERARWECTESFNNFE